MFQSIQLLDYIMSYEHKDELDWPPIVMRFCYLFIILHQTKL